jgi:hypothetical protein
MPLPTLAHQPIFRLVLNPSETWEHIPYPFNTLLHLKSHISPPLAVINAGPKLAGLNLDDVSLAYHEQVSSESQITTKKRLALLCSIWNLFMDARHLAKDWVTENRGQKRKRDQDDDEIESLSRRANRTTRSAGQSHRNPEPTPQPIQRTEISGTRKRDWETMSSSTTLTGDVLARLGKRPKTVESINEWVESTTRCLLK